MDDLQADIPPTAIPFMEQPGPKISLSADSSPLDFFSLFFNDVIIQMLVDGTNEYAGDVIAEKERAGKLTPKSRWVKWRPVTTEEMKAVLKHNHSNPENTRALAVISCFMHMCKKG